MGGYWKDYSGNFWNYFFKGETIAKNLSTRDY